MRRILLLLLLVIISSAPAQAKSAQEAFDTDALRPALQENLTTTPAPYIIGLKHSRIDKKTFQARNKDGELTTMETEVPIYVYQMSDGTTMESTSKLIEVRDTRSISEKYPVAFRRVVKVKKACHFFAPILNAAGAVAQIIYSTKS